MFQYFAVAKCMLILRKNVMLTAAKLLRAKPLKQTITITKIPSGITRFDC